jgi:dTDP-4-amino-4,6-dideoxygalactose transaminase
MKIPYVNLPKQYFKERKSLLSVIDKVLSSGLYVGGDQVEKFEKNISSLIKVKHCIALNSGTDALTLGLHCLGVKKNDEVITTSNSFIASTAVIVHLGAKPVFVDVKKDQNIDPNLIERFITKKTKAIMAVHLTGRVCDMDKIISISKKYNIPIIEDAAQAIGSKYKNKFAGTFGKVGCFSAHPLKNLNALGDSGYLTTNSSKIAKIIRDVRNHGMTNRNKIKNFGYVSRMDNLQAAVLNFRLKNLNLIIKKRRENASIYFKNLNKKYIFIPPETKKEHNTYHTFVIQVSKRDKLKKYLKSKNIETSIHYPIPIHLQPAFKKLKYPCSGLTITEKQSKEIITLPINQFLKKIEIKRICKEINNFYENI